MTCIRRGNTQRRLTFQNTITARALLAAASLAAASPAQGAPGGGVVSAGAGVISQQGANPLDPRKPAVLIVPSGRARRRISLRDCIPAM